LASSHGFLRRTLSLRTDGFLLVELPAHEPQRSLRAAARVSDVHKSGLEDVQQGRHGELLLVAGVGSELAALAVEDHGIGRVYRALPPLPPGA
jgi:hypothetical protein